MMGALKHKQVWKKQNVHRPSTNSNNKFKQQSSITLTSSPTVSIKTIESILHDRPFQNQLSIANKTSSDANNNSSIIKIPIITKRNIHFNEKVSVLLIPCRQEYVEANLSNVVWWKSPDYRQFQFDAFSEVKESLKGKILTSSNVKQALKELYQNENELKMNTYLNATVGSDINATSTTTPVVNCDTTTTPEVNCDDESIHSISTRASSAQSTYSLLKAVNMHHIRMNADSMIHTNNSNFAVISI